MPSGVTTRAELLAAGLSQRRIRQLVRDGALRPVLYGVYASAFAASMVGDSPLATGNQPGPAGSRRGPGGDLAGRRLLKVAAALAATSSLSVGSHRSAAQVHGLGLVRSGAAELVHLTRSRADRGSRTGRPGIRVHQAELPPEHVTKCRGVPVTSVGRTVVDLARALPFPEGVAVADSALPAGQTTPDELAAVLARCARWPGSQRARRVAAFSDPLAESVLESISRAAFREQGLPPRASGGGGR